MLTLVSMVSIQSLTWKQIRSLDWRGLGYCRYADVHCRSYHDYAPLLLQLASTFSYHAVDSYFKPSAWIRPDGNGCRSFHLGSPPPGILGDFECHLYSGGCG